MALVRIESRFAVWKASCHISSHVDGYSGIHFAMPEIDLFANVFEAETPGCGERYDFPVHALRPIAIGFDEIFMVYRLYFRPGKCLFVGLRRRQRHELFGCCGIESDHPDSWLKRESYKLPGRSSSYAKSQAHGSHHALHCLWIIHWSHATN